MNSDTNNQSTTSDDHENIPEVWNPAWATPVAVFLFLCSVIDLCIVVASICFVAYYAITGLSTFIWDAKPTETLLSGLIALCLLISLGLYPQGRQRMVCGKVMVILTMVILAIGIVSNMGKMISYGFLGTLILHGSIFIGIALIKLFEWFASPYRWREIHLKNNLCPRCRYNISNLPKPRCPECGETW